MGRDEIKPVAERRKPSLHLRRSYMNSSDIFVTLAERWNGINWSIQTKPNPAGTGSSALNRVSCPSKSAYTAVGN